MKKKKPSKVVYTTDPAEIMPIRSDKSLLLMQLMGWNGHFRTAIDKAKKPGRKRGRTRFRSIDDA